MKIEHIECEILCDNAALEEYQEKSDQLEGDEITKSCYIISEVGKRFVLRAKSNPHRFDAMFHLWIDGQCFDRVCMDRDDQHTFRGAYVGESQQRPYVFSPIMTTDDDRILQKSISTAKDLGTICLKIFRIEDIREDSDAESIILEHPKVENQPVHERTKKAGTHRVTLGDIEPIRNGQAVHVTYIDSLNAPYYTFTWRYRPQAILQAQGIIPRDPPPPSNKRKGSKMPPASSSKRPRLDQANPHEGSGSQVKPEDMEAARALQARRDALRAERVALEAREAALDEELLQADTRGAKREASPIVIGAGNWDVIDLTEDD